jgi:osmotically-inducible protein OsmY
LGTGVDASGISVSAVDGVVTLTLTGRVPVYVQKFQAEAATKGVSGVRAVVNDIGVQPPNGFRRSDAEIAAAALHTLQWDAEVPEDRIQVTVRDGWISLDGTVDQQFQKQAAHRAVRRLIGAEGVTNNIIVRPACADVLSKDIKSGIEAALKRHVLIDGGQIQVDVRHGTVTLRGTVHSHAARAEAEHVAWAAPGVNHVEDQLDVAVPRLTDAELDPSRGPSQDRRRSR